MQRCTNEKLQIIWFVAYKEMLSVIFSCTPKCTCQTFNPVFKLAAKSQQICFKIAIIYTAKFPNPPLSKTHQ